MNMLQAKHNLFVLALLPVLTAETCSSKRDLTGLGRAPAPLKTLPNSLPYEKRPVVKSSVPQEAQGAIKKTKPIFATKQELLTPPIVAKKGMEPKSDVSEPTYGDEDSETENRKEKKQGFGSKLKNFFKSKKKK